MARFFVAEFILSKVEGLLRMTPIKINATEHYYNAFTCGYSPTSRPNASA